MSNTATASAKPAEQKKPSPPIALPLEPICQSQIAHGRVIVIAAALGIFHIAQQAQLILQDDTATESDIPTGNRAGARDAVINRSTALQSDLHLVIPVFALAGAQTDLELTLVIGQGINMEPVRSTGERVSDNITRHEKDGRIYYRLSNGVVVGSTIAGHTMTIPELEQLAAGNYVYAEDFVSKKGSNFSARLVVEGKEVKFAFD